MTQIKTGFKGLHAYLCSLGRVTSLKAPIPWAVIHLRGSQWTAPALCVSRVCERLKVGCLNHSLLERVGEAAVGTVINSQEGAGNTSRLGTRSQETQSPSAWMPSQLLGILYENQISYLEAWLKAPCPFVFLLPNSIENTGNWQEAVGSGHAKSRHSTAEGQRG